MSNVNDLETVCVSVIYGFLLSNNFLVCKDNAFFYKGKMLMAIFLFHLRF